MAERQVDCPMSFAGPVDSWCVRGECRWYIGGNCVIPVIGAALVAIASHLAAQGAGWLPLGIEKANELLQRTLYEDIDRTAEASGDGE